MDENDQRLWFFDIFVFFSSIFWTENEILPSQFFLCRKHAWGIESGNFDGFLLFPQSLDPHKWTKIVVLRQFLCFLLIFRAGDD